MKKSFVQKHIGNDRPRMRQVVKPVRRNHKEVQNLLIDNGRLPPATNAENNPQQIDNCIYRHVNNNQLRDHIAVAVIPL